MKSSTLGLSLIVHLQRSANFAGKGSWCMFVRYSFMVVFIAAEALSVDSQVVLNRFIDTSLVLH